MHMQKVPQLNLLRPNFSYRMLGEKLIGVNKVHDLVFESNWHHGI